MKTGGGNRSRLPVNVLRLEVRGIRLRCARFPKQLKVKFPFRFLLADKDGFMFLPRDAAPFLGLVFGPEVRRDDRHGDPARAQGHMMQPPQETEGGRLASAERGKEIIGGGFEQFLGPQAIQRGRLERGGVAFAAAGLPPGLHLLHDGLPRALEIGGVAAGQVGAGQMQIEGRLALGLVQGVEQVARFGLVLGAETGLLAGGAVLAIIDLATAEQGEFKFHRHDLESCRRSGATR